MSSHSREDAGRPIDDSVHRPRGGVVRPSLASGPRTLDRRRVPPTNTPQAPQRIILDVGSKHQAFSKSSDSHSDYFSPDISDVLWRPVSLIQPYVRKFVNWNSLLPARDFPSTLYTNLPSTDVESDFRDSETALAQWNRNRTSLATIAGGDMPANGKSQRMTLINGGGVVVEDLPINRKPLPQKAPTASICEDADSCSNSFRNEETLRSSNYSLSAASRPPALGRPGGVGVDGIGGELTGAGGRYRLRGVQPIRVSGGGGGGGDVSVTGVSTASARSMIQGSLITFQDVHYVVPVRKSPCSRVVKKVVLDGVSGIMRPGVNAIMGPTGCGKSSLLDVLAGRKDPRYLTGEVLIDGSPQPKNFKYISGYVVQDDILMGTLTVRETLYLAAMLRRKRGYSKEETNEKVNEILEELSLTKIADNKIGTELVRGISGGEQKRTSIGMEIIADPSVLFLDEPTTGLDAFTAGSVIQTLKTLSRRGRTIVVSIHQPKYSIYKLFDSLTLMANGRIVYHGPAGHDPTRYFARLGYLCEEHNNPPDFFLDILHGEVKPTGAQGIRTFNDGNEDSHERMMLVSENLANEWSESNEYRTAGDEVMTIANRSSNAAMGGTAKDNEEIGYAAPFLRQMRVVCWRTFVCLMRDPQASIVQILVYLFFAISMGVVYFGLDTSLESGIQNRAGLFFFATLQVVFVNIGSIELFLKERALFVHEHSSGYYRVSSYFLAKLICDVFPTKALPVFFFMPITYWMARLVPEVGAFFFFELILTLGTVSAAAAAMAVSAAVSHFSIANVIISILFVFMMVFGGFLINLRSMTALLSWLRYISIFHFTFGGLLVNEMDNLVFCPTTNKTTNTFNDTRKCESGHLYLGDLGYASDTAWDKWSNVVGLTGITMFCFGVCYIFLRRINTYK